MKEAFEKILSLTFQINGTNIPIISAPLTLGFFYILTKLWKR